LIMRTLFVVVLAVVLLGLAAWIVIGALHR
jgi:hypothetical protein